MASSAIRGTTEHIVTKSSMVSYRLCHFWARNWPKTTLVLQAARRSDQRRHDDLLRTQARLRGLCAQAQVLPERSCAQNRALHSRSRSRQGPRDCKDKAYAVSRRERKKVEMLFAHLKRSLRLGRLRLRGPS